MAIHTPESLLREQLTQLRDLLPAVREGDVEGVHDARVATRRLRELLPLVASADDAVRRDTGKRLRAAGRALGRVRELDVLDALLSEQEVRATFASIPLSVARGSVVKARQKARRRLVKILDRRDVQDVVRRETPKSLSAFALTHSVRPRVWKRQTRMRIAARAATAIAAVDRSDAVYLPNRAHTARIALKKLRYAVEIAATTGLWPEPTPLKELRRAQASLGEVHDRQVLLDRLKGLHVPDESSHLTALGDLIRFDIEHEFQRYRARLDRLRAAIDECAVWSRPVIRPAIRRPLVALPLASLPLAAALIAPMLSPPRSAR